MPDLYLMRHGHYVEHRRGHHASPDAPLSTLGRAQTSRRLPLPTTITRIITSPLPRARQTAEVLSQASGIPIAASSLLLTEWRAPSSIIGRTPETYPPAYRAWRRQRTTRPHLSYGDGESLLALQARAVLCTRFLHEVAQDPGDILVVSHKILMGVLLHLPQGPEAFDPAARDPWPFTHWRRAHPVSCRGSLQLRSVF